MGGVRLGCEVAVACHDARETPTTSTATTTAHGPSAFARPDPMVNGTTLEDARSRGCRMTSEHPTQRSRCMQCGAKEKLRRLDGYLSAYSREEGDTSRPTVDWLCEECWRPFWSEMAARQARAMQQLLTESTEHPRALPALFRFVRTGAVQARQLFERIGVEPPADVAEFLAEHGAGTADLVDDFEFFAPLLRPPVSDDELLATNRLMHDTEEDAAVATRLLLGADAAGNRDVWGVPFHSPWPCSLPSMRSACSTTCARTMRGGRARDSMRRSRRCGTQSRIRASTPTTRRSEPSSSRVGAAAVGSAA